jgi:hypothetical protein
MKYTITYWDREGTVIEYLLSTRKPLPSNNIPFDKVLQDQIADAIGYPEAKDWLDGDFAFFDWEEYTDKIEHKLEN